MRTPLKMRTKFIVGTFNLSRQFWIYWLWLRRWFCLLYYLTWLMELLKKKVKIWLLEPGGVSQVSFPSSSSFSFFLLFLSLTPRHRHEHPPSSTQILRSSSPLPRLYPAMVCCLTPQLSRSSCFVALLTVSSLFAHNGPRFDRRFGALYEPKDEHGTSIKHSFASTKCIWGSGSWFSSPWKSDLEVLISRKLFECCNRTSKFGEFC